MLGADLLPQRGVGDPSVARRDEVSVIGQVLASVLVGGPGLGDQDRVFGWALTSPCSRRTTWPGDTVEDDSPCVGMTLVVVGGAVGQEDAAVEFCESSMVFVHLADHVGKEHVVFKIRRL